MAHSSSKSMSGTDFSTSNDLFHQLLNRYIHQVGITYESAKDVQEAVRNLEKDLRLPTRHSAKSPR